MKVSVVVPVYNVPVAYLDPCLTALSRQSFRQDDFEIVIIDDASDAPDTIAAVDAFVARQANARLVRHPENRGANEARRTGAHNAVGDYVVYVDGDDILARDAAERLWMTAVAASADLVTAPLRRWYPDALGFDRYPSSERPLPAGLEGYRAIVAGECSFTMCGRAIRRSLLTDSVFDLPSDIHHEDLITWARLVFAASRITHFRHPVYYYATRAGSSTSHFTDAHVDGRLYALREWAELAERKGVLLEVTPDAQRGAERFVTHMVERVAFDESRPLAERAAAVRDIGDSYRSLPIPVPTPTGPATRLLASLRGGPDDVERLRRFTEDPKARPSEDRRRHPEFGLAPSEMALATKDKVVFVCQVDHHLRNAAKLARELRRRGHASVILDNSGVTANGRRQLSKTESKMFWRTRRIRVEKFPYDVDWLSTAKLVVTFNDFNDDFREALEYRHLLGLPTAGIVEGINDFLRLDFDTPRTLPYRRCDYVFLAGEADKQFFADRSTCVVGLPFLESLTEASPVFPEEPTAALNVNFTYGCLEDRRDLFVEQAVAGIREAGFRLRITQHPMDEGDLAGLPVTAGSQYELIESSSVFVSRFATGILEALAMGKPVVYFNPHGERVAKFKEPQGAFDVATTPAELAEALRRVKADIASGVDFRRRAAAFLAWHASLDVDGLDAASRCADHVAAICDATVQPQLHVARHLIGKMGWQPALDAARDTKVFGPFDRDAHAQMHEEEVIGRNFGHGGRLMVDVGANFGNSLDVFLGKGWVVHAFEPDPKNREALLESYPNEARLTITDQAASDTSGALLPFYASEESTGISSLAAFTDGHVQVATVTTTTLDDYMREAGIEHVDFLKVDVEGFDKFVLDGFPWDRDRPDVVLVEFEDFKTVPLGYNTQDLAAMLENFGYTVYASIWHPVIRYGIAHDWSSLERYRPDLALAETWGNLIAFREAPDEGRLREICEISLKFVPSSAAGKADKDASGGRPTRAARLQGRSALVSRAAKLAAPAARLARRRWPATVLASLLIVLALAIGLAWAGTALGSAAIVVAVVGIASIEVVAGLVIVRKTARKAGRRQREQLASLREEIIRLERRLVESEKSHRLARIEYRVAEVRSDLDVAIDALRPSVVAPASSTEATQRPGSSAG